MQWTVTEMDVFGGTVEADTAEDAVRTYIKQHPQWFDNGTRFVKVADVEYKVAITRGVVDGVDEVQP